MLSTFVLTRTIALSREKNIAFEHLENLPQEDPDPTGVVVDEERRTCWSVAICRRNAEAAITDGEPFQGEDALAVTTANM
ncbi:hypothetical protein PHLCEN_2v6309 [Hermanssonia centrifuga]|uniref:Uncharacterized protein n=1 Tax=Hermanssonia centrifuga TaxID=98765 RepID=A0A2R6NZR8_9APHY|nr:hypothetical protein PHLCEN_2v6309 [Hermanssonia centrifuga]